MKSSDENQQKTEETFKIASDILIDILAILLSEDLFYEISQIQEMKKIAVITVQFDKSISRQIKVRENIQNLMALYEDYRFNDSEQTDWREN